MDVLSPNVGIQDTAYCMTGVRITKISDTLSNGSIAETVALTFTKIVVQSDGLAAATFDFTAQKFSFGTTSPACPNQPPPP